MKKIVPINDFAIDTFDPGVVSSKIGFFKALFRMYSIAHDCIIPCIVRKYYPETGLVDAQPIVNNIKPTVDGNKQIERPVYRDVPVLHICHGGFEVSAPLFSGDTGLLVAIDRNCATAISANSSVLTEDQPEKGGKNKGPMPIDDLSTASFDHSVFIPFSFAAGNAEKGVLTIKKIGENQPYITLGDDKAIVNTGKSSISVTDESIELKHDGDKITISSNGIKYEGKIDERVEALTNIRYDKGSHTIQKKVTELMKRGDFIVGVGIEGPWDVIEGGETVPLPE